MHWLATPCQPKPGSNRSAHIAVHRAPAFRVCRGRSELAWPRKAPALPPVIAAASSLWAWLMGAEESDSEVYQLMVLGLLADLSLLLLTRSTPCTAPKLTEGGSGPSGGVRSPCRGAGGNLVVNGGRGD
jgi:hypothetical protein